MPLSKASRNDSTWPALSALAADAMRSRTSLSESARRHAAIDNNSNRRRVISCPIAAVDADVAFGEVARPESRRSFALAADGDYDVALRGVQLLLELGFRKFRRQSAAA